MSCIVHDNISKINSSIIPLTTGSSFVGQWEEASNHSNIIIAVATDQNGILKVEYSPDGINVDSILTTYYKINYINPPHNYTNTRKYVRVSFQNTSLINQTFFRLQVVLSSSPQLNIPLGSTISPNYDSISVRPTNYSYEIALNQRQGLTNWNKFGYNPDVDGGAPEVIASFGGLYTPLYVPEALQILSSSGNDTALGTGARQIKIWGIDGNFKNISEIITLNGTTPVALTIPTWYCINRASVYLAGDLRQNDGIITIRTTAGQIIQGEIPAGSGSTQQMIFGVGERQKALITCLFINGTKLSGVKPGIEFKIFVYSYLTNSTTEIFRYTIDTSVESTLDYDPVEPYVIEEKSIVWIQAQATSNDTIVSGRMSILLSENPDYT